MASKRQKFLSSQVEPGKGNEPCQFNYVFPARIALSSESTTPFMNADFLKVPDLPVQKVDPYRYTLRRMRLGEIYVLEKAHMEFFEFPLDDWGQIKKQPGSDLDTQPWITLDKTVTNFYIAFSQWKWDDNFKAQVIKNPENHMQKVTLEAGQNYVGSANLISELVEEYREKPGKLMSLRGFPKAKTICDSESVYADDDVYAPAESEGKIGQRKLVRRWRDGSFDFRWTPIKKGTTPTVPCPTAQMDKRVFLLAVHDSVGIAREFASLQQTSVATLTARNDWYAYLHTIANYVNTLLAVNPSYGQHLQQNYFTYQKSILGPWLFWHGDRVRVTSAKDMCKTLLKLFWHGAKMGAGK